MPDLLFQVSARIELFARPTQDGLLERERQFAAVLLIDLSPGVISGRLGIDHQPIEVED